ncbi:MAG: CehA/McbA family metallohydrolase [Acidobacteria bacterium]|nr:CehA/McbA family metallohydrolase [Acidobacteriota bacterium]
MATSPSRAFLCASAPLRLCVMWLLFLSAQTLSSQTSREPVLKQIALPHSYYTRELYLPQLTSGPASVAWSPDGRWLVYSMGGFLWKQRVGATLAEQLTDSDGTDHQPDWSPDGASIAFVRYTGRAMELMRLDLAKGKETALTANGAVNVEPRWSPDGSKLAFVSTEGTGHFLLKVAAINAGKLAEVRTLTPDRRSAIPRYYYSPFDHALNPTWTRDGRELLFLSNREVGHGSGDLVRMSVEGGPQTLVQREETSWHARPDVAPDGKRLVYSSYQGAQWHQLWLLPTQGGHPFQLTFGDWDATNPRWSPDGKQIAFISNREGNTALKLLDTTSGQETAVEIRERRTLAPRVNLEIRIQDEAGHPMPARVSLRDGRGRTFAPEGAWIQADDLLVPTQRAEGRTFHVAPAFTVSVPKDRLRLTLARGPEFAVAQVDVDARGSAVPIIVPLKRLPFPGAWWSGDLHVHLNYGGTYRNSPARMVQQARAEGLGLVYNLIVNKEQRYPDLASFRTDLDPASTGDVLLLHGQEFHSSYWGHLGLLNLREHLIMPGYTAYPFTGAASPYPHNGAVADRAHAQGGLVGYVHPFDEDVKPATDAKLTNALPIDAALGKVDYYEAVGFSDHMATNAIWYRLLNCGLRLPAGAGTDVMANYASLRGPVGLNRVYVKAEGPLQREPFLAGLKAGRTFATNGALLDLRVGKAAPGDTLELGAGAQELEYAATLRSNHPVDHLELIWNGEVVGHHAPKSGTADVTGRVKVKGPGWLLLRAWNDAPHANVLDIYPFATTSPIYAVVAGKPVRSKAAATYFLAWLDRIQKATEAHPDYRTAGEREAVLADIRKARAVYEACRDGANAP